MLGVKGTPTKTQTYSVTFVLGVASSVSAADSAAFSVVPPSSPFVAPVQKNPLEVEVRVFEDNGIHFLSLSAKMGSTVRDKEIRIPDDDYVKLTWGDVKARLDTHWPKSTNVGYCSTTLLTVVPFSQFHVLATTLVPSSSSLTRSACRSAASSRIRSAP